MDFDPSNAKEDFPNRHELLVKNSELLNELIRMLRFQREPDIEETMFYIDAQKNGLVLPDSVLCNISQDSVAQDLYITATVNRLIDTAELDLEVTIPDGLEANGMRAHMRTGLMAPDCSVFVRGTELPCLNPLTRSNFNRLLASLMSRNKTGDFSRYDSMDTTDAGIAERLLKAIAEERHIDQSITYAEYILSPQLSLDANAVRFTEYDENMYEATVLMQLEEGGAIAAKVDFRQKKDRMKMHPSMRNNTEFAIQSMEGLHFYKIDINGDATPIDTTNELLVTINDFIESRFAEVFPEPENITLGQDDIADETSDTNIEDLRDFNRE